MKMEQKGKHRAEYGEKIIQKIAVDLTKSFERGFSERKLEKYRQFYLCYSYFQKELTVSAKSYKYLKIKDFLNTAKNYSTFWC